jgi:hypothetical protein
MAELRAIHYKRWFWNFLLFSLAPLFLVALFNYLVDVAGLFHFNKGLKYVAENLLAGKMVAGVSGGYEEREFQRLIVENYPKRRDVILIGSSRTMHLRRDFIGGEVDFFNHSMTQAGLEDCISIIGLYKIKGDLPKTVVLGIDPWIFNENNRIPECWKSLSRYYEKLVTEINAKETKRNVFQLNKYMQVINLDYTRANYKSYRRSKKIRSKKLYVTPTVDVDDVVREPDGSFHFPHEMRFREDGSSSPYSPQGTMIRYLNNFGSLSGIELFEDFVLYLQKKEVKVILLLMPFHPLAYKLFNDNPQYQIVISLEKYLRDFAFRNHIKVIGSYNPERYRLKGEDFIDDTHGREIVMRKIFKEYR